MPKGLPGRTSPLTKQRIVEAAIELLDRNGERALTFRALTEHLSTGPGAIYWHISDKSDLLRSASEGVVARVVTSVHDGDPASSIRMLALGVFDSLSDHPWVGGQLVREPWQPALLRVFDAIGGHLAALGVRPEHRFDVASTIVGYVLGVAGQFAAGARLASRSDRGAFLSSVASRWAEGHDPDAYPFMREVAAQLADHDDRAQFIAGIDLLLAGVAAASR